MSVPHFSLTFYFFFVAQKIYIIFITIYNENNGADEQFTKK